jgi:hypothetical protein
MTVEVFVYDPAHHDEADASARNQCGQGGQDTCHKPPVSSVLGRRPNYVVAACDDHVAGALRQALGLLRSNSR